MTHRDRLTLRVALALLIAMAGCFVPIAGAADNPVRITAIKVDPPSPNSLTKNVQFTLTLTNTGTATLGGPYQHVQFYCSGPTPCKHTGYGSFYVDVGYLFPNESSIEKISTGQWSAGNYEVVFFLTLPGEPDAYFNPATVKKISLTVPKVFVGKGPARGTAPLLPPSSLRSARQPAGGSAKSNPAGALLLITPTPAPTRAGGRRLRLPPAATPTPTATSRRK
jgi:hypothetical protein